GFVTVTDTRITADLREATVFYTVFGSEAERADSAAALESAKGIIRSEVGRQTGVRFTPMLTFKHDPIPESARQLDDLITAARARDAEVARQAQNATYAGEPDPYRKPDDDERDGLAESCPPTYATGRAGRPGAGPSRCPRSPGSGRSGSSPRPTRSRWRATSRRTATRSGRCWPSGSCCARWASGWPPRSATTTSRCRACSASCRGRTCWCRRTATRPNPSS